MTYNEFKNIVKEKILEYMPDEFRNHELITFPVEKTNAILDGLSIKKKDGISHIIYINDMYQSYLQGDDLEQVLKSTCDLIVERYDEVPSINRDEIRENLKEKIVFRIINTQMNLSMLEHVPHRAFHDLSIIYEIVFNQNDMLCAIKVTHEIAEAIGMNEEKLYHCAYLNTRKMFPSVVRSVLDMLRENFIDESATCLSIDKDLWAITNVQDYYGAANMLYEDRLYELAKKLESNLYILPSSVHEVLAIAADIVEPEEMLAAVSYVNTDVIEDEEILSNSVYFYDRNTRQITMVAHKLHTMVTETFEGGIEERLVSLQDGTGMGGELIVFRTNAPVDELKKLEYESCQCYINGVDDEDIPIWQNELEAKGYTFSYIDSYENVTAFATSDEWMQEMYPVIEEHYLIDDQQSIR